MITTSALHLTLLARPRAGAAGAAAAGAAGAAGRPAAAARRAGRGPRRRSIPPPWPAPRALLPPVPAPPAPVPPVRRGCCRRGTPRFFFFFFFFFFAAAAAGARAACRRRPARRACFRRRCCRPCQPSRLFPAHRLLLSPWYPMPQGYRSCPRARPSHSTTATGARAPDTGAVFGRCRAALEAVAREPDGPEDAQKATILLRKSWVPPLPDDLGKAQCGETP